MVSIATLEHATASTDITSLGPGQMAQGQQESGINRLMIVAALVVVAGTAKMVLVAQLPVLSAGHQALPVLREHSWQRQVDSITMSVDCYITPNWQLRRNVRARGANQGAPGYLRRKHRLNLA